ncbi:MAG: FkbM family methyltransferase [Thermoleophilia bacterium]|nr:FkbM family methyltransferase [Thermoleophilia bacterium]
MSVRAKEALLDLVLRTLTGCAADSTDRPGLRRSISVNGFRHTARALLLRHWLHSHENERDAVLLCPALEGRFTLAIAAADGGVGREILESGTWEPHVVAFYRNVIRPGMTVVDVGANVGFHTLHAATLVGPQRRVIAVEPDARNAALIRLSLRLAQEPLPVEVIEAALSDRAGELVLTDLGNAANSGARFTHEDLSVLEQLVHGPSPRFERVQALRWDEAHPDVHPDLVKIDVEGFEARVVRGMSRTIERDRPVVVSELAPGNLREIGRVEPAEYLSWFRERDYGLAVIADDGSTQPTSAEAALQTLGGRHHVDVVFTPIGSSS